MTSLNDRSNTDNNELSIDELNAKWDALENDPEFLAKPIWQQIVEIGNVLNLNGVNIYPETLPKMLNIICMAHPEKMRKNETDFFRYL